MTPRTRDPALLNGPAGSSRFPSEAWNAPSEAMWAAARPDSRPAVAAARDGLWTAFFSRFPIAQIDLRYPSAQP